MERYEVCVRIHSECEKMQTRITLNMDTFSHSVNQKDLSNSLDLAIMTSSVPVQVCLKLIGISLEKLWKQGRRRTRS